MKHYTLLIVALFAAISSYAIAPITGTASVCTGSTVTLSDATTGGAWSSSTTTTATVGTGGIVTGVAAGVATISYTSGGSTATFSITVNAVPMLSSSLTPPAICDSSVFNYNPSGSTIGSEFDWFRVSVTGIYGSTTGNGTGNPYEILFNTTDDPISVTYIYIIYYNGCLNEENVSVIVNPIPVLSSALTLPGICDSTGMITYTPTSSTPGAVFEWDRPAVFGITPTTSFSTVGSGGIAERLTDDAHHPITVTYFYRLGIGSCTNLYTQAVNVTIDSCAFLATPTIANLATIEITPNPTTGPITINKLQPNDEIEIYSLLGKKVFTHKQLSGSSATIDLINEPGGVYFARINSAGIIQTQKIVKQ